MPRSYSDLYFMMDGVKVIEVYRDAKAIIIH